MQCDPLYAPPLSRRLAGIVLVHAIGVVTVAAVVIVIVIAIRVGDHAATHRTFTRSRSPSQPRRVRRHNRRRFRGVLGQQRRRLLQSGRAFGQLRRPDGRPGELIAVLQHSAGRGGHAWCLRADLERLGDVLG